MEEGTFTVLLSLVLISITVVLTRLALILPAANRRYRPPPIMVKKDGRRDGKIMILLGSGGHTGEMLKILQQGEVYKKMKREYYISSGDETSVLKLKNFEENVMKSTTKDYEVINVYRARGIGDGKFVTFFKTLWSFKSIMSKISFDNDILLTNGPGTAIPLAYTMFIMKLFGSCKTRIIYVESLARVYDLSLTGKLILPISDRVIVQWKALSMKYNRCEYYGMLV